MTIGSQNDSTSNKRHKTQFRIPLFEVDIGQAVYHGNYFHLFELGREAFLRDLGYPYRRLMDQELHLTIVEVSCNYRRPLHYDELVEIRTGVNWIRNRSLSLSQDIYLVEGAAEPILCTAAVFNLVCIHFSGKAVTIPKDFAQRLEQWTFSDA